MNLPVLYSGSVKEVRGPFGEGAVVFDYSDSFSVFDWGRMPDELPRKGEALAVLAAWIFESLEDPESWREFSKSPEAFELRKASRYGARFNEWGETLQKEGLRTHYLGVVEGDLRAKKLKDVARPFKCFAVRGVTVKKPVLSTVLGRAVPDYSEVQKAKAPRLLPIEVVFRFSCGPGSSLLSRREFDPKPFASEDMVISEGARFGFPLLELFTKLEPTDRLISASEAVAISGLSDSQLESVLFQTAWVAGFLRALFGRAGLELADGKLEWALDEKGEPFLVDAVGPDELRILKGEVQISKEFLRSFYRATEWSAQLKEAKARASQVGVSDWKKWMSHSAPPRLPKDFIQAGSQLYLTLTNALTQKSWFFEAWDLVRLTEELGKLQKEIQNSGGSS